MTGSEFIARVFPYIAVGFFFVGTAWRFIHWLSLPVHVKWTLYPVPTGIAGQLKYMVKEIFTFETLYRFNRRLWAGTFTMHMAMLGFVIFLVLCLMGWTSGLPVRFFLWVLLISLIYIIMLRIFDRNLRALSTFEEHFNLIFMALVTATGLMASLPHGSFSPRSYIESLLTFQPGGTPLDWDQRLAVLLGGLFLIYLPWSKMIHYISKYFTYHHINWQKE
ncbi:MAG: respiratory nitrate reductase subunit gamma [Methanoregulaceae archaeon]|nr:respiratory nitrate reductase subunit gamma [Methanoregulaceae archaeon]